MRFAVVVLTLVVALAGLAPVAIAQTSGDVLVIEGLALPQSHRYEIYNESGGTYSPIDVHTVPSYVQKKTRVYDRTAKVWVVDASGNVDSRYRAGSGQSATSSSQSGTSSTTQTAQSGQWQRIHGKVESVQGTTLTLRADDGRTLTVDTSQVDSSVRQALTQGEGVTVIGHPGTAANQMRANYVQQDSSDPSHGGKVVGSGSSTTPSSSTGASTTPKSGDWQRIHGKIQSVQGNTLTLRTDDGRVLTVDASRVDSKIRQGLTQGEGVTVIGNEWTGPTNLRASYVQQDSSDASRGGKTAPSASPRQ
jgi:preprotein translocase subunit YajC